MTPYDDAFAITDIIEFGLKNISLKMYNLVTISMGSVN